MLSIMAYALMAFSLICLFTASLNIFLASALLPLFLRSALQSYLFVILLYFPLCNPLYTMHPQYLSHFHSNLIIRLPISFNTLFTFIIPPTARPPAEAI